MDHQVAISVRLAFILSARQRDRRLAAHIDHGRNVVLVDGFFEKRDVEFFQSPSQLDRVHRVKAAIGVDIKPDIGAGGVAHRTYPQHILGDGVFQRAGFVAPRQRIHADGHFQFVEALIHPVAGRIAQLVAVEKPEAEGGVNGHRIARAAQQSPDRQIQRLALDIPQRDVDGGDGVHAVAALSARAQLPV